jgi:ankyrin repeat protein
VSKELKNIRLNSGNRTREKIFNEIHALLLTWDQRELSICQKCCEFSTIDNSDHLYEPNIEEIFRIIINTDTTTHSCTNTNALGWHITSGIIPYASDMAGMAFNLFTCYADGYGVDTNIDGDAGLSWLIKAAQWGSLMCQSYAPTLYFRKHRRLPSHIPSVKWLVISVLVYGSQTAREVLQVTHPQILLATENARCMMMGTGFSLDEWQAGLEIKSWTTPQIEEILMKLAASRNFTGFGGIWAKLTNTLQNTLSILFPRNCDAYWPMVVSPSLDQILQGNDYLHAAVSNWTQPFEFCYKYLDMFPNSIDRPNHLGETPLLLACRAGRLQMVMLLVDKGANVSIPAGSNGETPLHWLALLSDSQDQIETLLARGADIDALTTDPRYYRGRYPGFPKNPRDCLRPGTPLDWAIQASNRLMVRFLLDHGADPLFGYRTRDSPIERAVLVRDTAILQLCVDAVDETPDDLNLFKAFYRNVSVTQRVILGVSEQDEIRIIETIVSSLPKLSSATDIEKKIFIPLRMAVQSLSLKMIACILDKMEEAIDRLKVEFVPGSQTVERQQWQRFGYNLAAVAIKRNDAAIVEFLIRRASERGYDILDDWLPYTVFELTTGPDNPEILDILLRHGISLNTRDNSGLLPLHSAILCGNLKVANRLVAAMTEHEFESTLGQNSFMAFPGASCPGNMMTFFGYIISHRQKYRADMKSFKWLFTLPPSATEFFDITKTNKTTALHLAAEDLPFAHNAFVHLSQRPVLEFLLNKFKGPQHVNAKNYLDSTPLHIAAFMGNCEYAELLVEAGADINALGTGGTPLDATFASPPQHFRAIEGGPTQEIVRRFVEGRNRIAVMLRKRGAKAMQEIGSKRRLGNWIPFPFGLGGSGPVVPHLMLVLSGRILVRRYGCLVQVPVYTKPGFIPGELKGPQFPVSILSSTYS